VELRRPQLGRLSDPTPVEGGGLQVSRSSRSRPTPAPPTTCRFALKDNKDKDSASVLVKDYCPGNTFPKDFVTVKIPMGDFLTDKSKFESGVAWGSWCICGRRKRRAPTSASAKIAFVKE